ncbi:MAG: LamG domain-containing protein, partial [Verrucomicrobiales bacterium]|nr:LamG domain-containing protein [Verrucomicrobiales bacterium]
MKRPGQHRLDWILPVGAGFPFGVAGGGPGATVIARITPGMCVRFLGRLHAATIALLAMLVTGVPSLNAQPAGTRQVLDLDGTNACVVLPSGIVTNDVVTVEGWFKWRRFNSHSRLLEFFGERVPFSIMNRGTLPNLHFDRPERNASGRIHRFAQVTAPGLLATNEWCHVAAVVRTNSTRLFFNGVLVSTEEISYDWTPPVEPDRTNYLGRSAMVSERQQGFNPDFDGQMAEVRIWNGERTEAQLRENMFKDLTGAEPGLAGLWNFGKVANGVVPDASPFAHHGRLIGNAKTVEAPGPGSTEATALGNVLELDGNNSYVELPPRIFKNLTNATVEAWVKWERLGLMYFYSYGGLNRDVFVGAGRDSGSLWFGVSPEGGRQEMIRAGQILRSREWCHVAAVMGQGGMKLFLNGVLVGKNDSTFSFADLLDDAPNYIGRMNAGPDFRGQIDEFRVWRVARTEEQIRAQMNQSLTGSEPGLAGLWNFADGTARDSSTNAHHGTLRGGAKVVQVARLSIKAPTVLSGKTTDL